MIKYEINDFSYFKNDNGDLAVKIRRNFKFEFWNMFLLSSEHFKWSRSHLRLICDQVLIAG